MKRSKQQLIGIFVAALLSCAGLVSCSKDDTAAPGEYPLTLTASVEGMTTRSTGKDAWEGTEEIAVRMVTGETTAESKYVIGNAEGTSVSPAAADQTLYWQTSDPVTITSWYPYEAQANIDITDQKTNGFAAFDYLTATAENQPYGNTVELKFKHQMAKVSCTLTAGDGISADDIASATVRFAGYTTASFSEGALTGSTDGWITPTSDKDVLLVPQDMSGKQFIKVSINGSSYAFTPTDADLRAGCHYTYNITVSKAGLTVTASSSIDWGTGATGSGTVDYIVTTDASGTTYTVYNEAGLWAWAEYTSNTDLATNCTLAADITMSGSSYWTAVGSSLTNSYTGTFDGSGHTIRKLAFNASSVYQGLIGCLGSGGVVQNLTLAGMSITSTDDYVGAVVGYNYGTVTNCTVSGTVTGNMFTGGVVGYNNGGTVTACYSTGTVTGNGNYTGGVAGCNWAGAVTACYSTGEITGNGSYTGGVLGLNDEGNVTACYFAGAVSSMDTHGFTGGVIGSNNTAFGGTIATCYWTNSSSDTGEATTGIGTNTGTDGTTYVDGTDVTWQSAATAMNTALTGSGWQYTGDGTDDPPLTLVTE